MEKGELPFETWQHTKIVKGNGHACVIKYDNCAREGHKVTKRNEFHGLIDEAVSISNIPKEPLEINLNLKLDSYHSTMMLFYESDPSFLLKGGPQAREKERDRRSLFPSCSSSTTGRTSTEPPPEAWTSVGPPPKAWTSVIPPAEARISIGPPIEAQTSAGPLAEAETSVGPPSEARTSPGPPIEARTSAGPPPEAQISAGPPPEA
ncbi:hypothetical protein IEQ34_006352 [Dendrobium chrysotoxum]|uniref:Uncharacterized protein n=1 Tax=Dendrobium chrysotoxum TaxID=161865 RepID=A0AAV7HEP3_DENCH|nr:hypothetical protein IEQ34_006352 [Dendrobium chrysotoxum]